MLHITTLQEYISKISKKEIIEDKEREERKRKYIEELEKIGFSDITKFRFKWKVGKTETGEEWLKPIIKIETGAEEKTCSTAAIQELSWGKYGPKIKTHDKVNPLWKLLDREDKLEESANKKKEEQKDNIENDGFLKALEGVAEKVCKDEE